MSREKIYDFLTPFKASFRNTLCDVSETFKGGPLKGLFERWRGMISRNRIGMKRSGGLSEGMSGRVDIGVRVDSGGSCGTRPMVFSR